MDNDSFSKEEIGKLEGNKLVYDMLKHLTTLNTGSIIILGTFLTEMFSKPVGIPALTVAVVGFISSLICSFVSMIFAANRVYYSESEAPSHTRFLSLFTTLAIVCFVTAVAFLGIFVLCNINA